MTFLPFSCTCIVSFIVVHIQTSLTVKFNVIGPSHPIIAFAGGEAVLPCHLSPTVNAEGMEVRWISGRHQAIVHLYRHGKDWNEEQMSEYRGRTEFMRNDIKNSSVALMVRGVKLLDEGHYSCFFQSDAFYDEAPLELRVAGLGTAPHLHVDGYHDNGIQVVCTSPGWYPEPEVMWRGENRTRLKSFIDKKMPDENGLFSVENSVIITQGFGRRVSCFIRNTFVNHEKEAAISIAESFFPKLSVWMVCFCMATAALISLIVLAAWYFSKERKEKDALCRELDWRTAVMNPEKVILDSTTANPELIVSEDGKSVTRIDTKQDVPDCPQRFNSARCILGSEGFTMGRHYWEVLVEQRGDWAVGVTKESVTRKGLITLTPEDGIWSAGVTGGQFQVLANP